MPCGREASRGSLWLQHFGLCRAARLSPRAESSILPSSAEEVPGGIFQHISTSQFGERQEVPVDPNLSPVTQRLDARRVRAGWAMTPVEKAQASMSLLASL